MIPAQALRVDGPAPWLSVIVPSFRAEHWIDSALSSLSAQPSDGIEVVLIDGGPTSAAAERAARHALRLDLRIIERHDLSTWQSKANFGVSVARATHACLLPVDDVWLPGRAAAVRNWIGSSPDAVLHLAPSAIIDRTGRNLGWWRCPLPDEKSLEPAFVAERLLIQNFVAAPAAVFRKDRWLACGGLDEQLWYSADWDVWLKLCAEGHVVYHREATIGFRIHGDSLTVTGSRDIADFSAQMRSVLERHLPSIDDRNGRLAKIAEASVIVNCALAAASTGNYRLLGNAASAVCRLGPAGIRRYFRDSRVLDRLVPRIRARLRGSL
jgi:glycosyltransferase involved in cell wall biosynthesis